MEPLCSILRQMQSKSNHIRKPNSPLNSSDSRLLVLVLSVPATQDPDLFMNLYGTALPIENQQLFRKFLYFVLEPIYMKDSNPLGPLSTYQP